MHEDPLGDDYIADLAAKDRQAAQIVCDSYVDCRLEQIVNMVDQDEIDSSDSQNLILNSASVLVPIGAGFNLAFRSKKLMELSVITASAVATGATTAIDIADLLPFQHDKMPGDVVIFTYVIGSKLKGNPYTNHSKNVQFTKLRRIRKDN